MALGFSVVDVMLGNSIVPLFFFLKKKNIVLDPDLMCKLLKSLIYIHSKSETF